MIGEKLRRFVPQRSKRMVKKSATCFAEERSVSQKGVNNGGIRLSFASPNVTAQTEALKMERKAIKHA
jgi:hypothetical protein